ncbi:MAG TPA: TonB-dependent receptor [Myxococcota bacterium]|nr:TonB-dependent receptor [Myxococcota bacterium]
MRGCQDKIIVRVFFLLVQLALPLTVSAGDRPKNPDSATGRQDAETDLSDEFAFLEDANVVELASRHRQEIGMSPSAVTVLTRVDIEASGATNIPDLLRLVPGMDVVVVSPSFTSLSSRMYWTNANNHYQVLIDGRDAVNELLGEMPWAAEIISLDDVERIEILRGPASSLYGASGLAGVISITTREIPENSSASVRFAGGEVGTLEAGARGSIRTGNWGFSLSGAGDIGSSFFAPRVRSKQVYKVRSVAEYRWSNSKRLLLEGGFSESEGNLNTSIGQVGINFGLRTLRLSYASEDIRTRLFWSQAPVSFEIEAPLEYQKIRLATFVPVTADSHIVDGDVQWTLPKLVDPLLLIVGGSARVSWIGSDQLLDGDSYADLTSPRYHKPGISYWEGRGGAFAHAEYVPGDWLTMTGSLRIDYNTETHEFVSPRLAAVFCPKKGQYVRVGVGRAFRKPAFVDSRLHAMVEFPKDSPIGGADQDKFQEFMSRAMGNSDLPNEKLISFEFGYLGQFLDGRLSVAIDLYYNQLRSLIKMSTNVVAGGQGLPDLEKTTMKVNHDRGDVDIQGIEIVVRFQPAESIALLASWAHREVFDHELAGISETTPKNLFTLGGRFGSEVGLIGSLYLFSRSEFLAEMVENPEGPLSPYQNMHLDNVFLILGKLGWKWQPTERVELEAGTKLFLPVSPFSAPYFRYYEDGGGVSSSGEKYGGEQLSRMVTAYLQGSF